MPQAMNKVAKGDEGTTIHQADLNSILRVLWSFVVRSEKMSLPRSTESTGMVSFGYPKLFIKPEVRFQKYMKYDISLIILVHGQSS